MTAIHEGYGQRFVGDVIEDFQPGDVVLVGPNLPHAWFCSSKCHRVEATVIQFHLDELGAGVLLAPELCELREFLNNAACGLVVPEVFAEKTKKLRVMFSVDSLVILLGLLVEMSKCNHRNLYAKVNTKPLADMDMSRMNCALRYMNELHCKPLRLVEVARHVALGPEAFSRLFRRATGRTFIETLTSIRLASAMSCLRAGHEKLEVIAASCGFADMANFRRQFRRRYGCAPSEVRRRDCYKSMHKRHLCLGSWPGRQFQSWHRLCVI